MTLDVAGDWLDDTCPGKVIVETGGELCCCWWVVDLITTAVPVPIRKLRLNIYITL